MNPGVKKKGKETVPLALGHQGGFCPPPQVGRGFRSNKAVNLKKTSHTQGRPASEKVIVWNCSSCYKRGIKMQFKKLHILCSRNFQIPDTTCFSHASFHFARQPCCVEITKLKQWKSLPIIIEITQKLEHDTSKPASWARNSTLLAAGENASGRGPSGSRPGLPATGLPAPPPALCTGAAPASAAPAGRTVPEKSETPLVQAPEIGRGPGGGMVEILITTN